MLAIDAYDKVRLTKEGDEVTNEIESQWPQMIVLFETSQAWTDENLSHFQWNKSDLSANENSNELLIDNKSPKYDDKVPPSINSN